MVVRHRIKIFLVWIIEERNCKMASKLRRTPLFGCDGNLGIPIVSNGSSAKSQKSTSSYEYKVCYKSMYHKNHSIFKIYHGHQY